MHPFLIQNKKKEILVVELELGFCFLVVVAYENGMLCMLNFVARCGSRGYLHVNRRRTMPEESFLHVTHDVMKKGFCVVVVVVVVAVLVCGSSHAPHS